MDEKQLAAALQWACEVNNAKEVDGLTVEVTLRSVAAVLLSLQSENARFKEGYANLEKLHRAYHNRIGKAMSIGTANLVNLLEENHTDLCASAADHIRGLARDSRAQIDAKMSALNAVADFSEKARRDAADAARYRFILPIVTGELDDTDHRIGSIAVALASGKTGVEAIDAAMADEKP